MMQEIINAVPVGAENALPSRDIWKIVDCWAENTIASRLAHFADLGSIKSRKEPIPSGFKYVYWREVA